MQKPVPGNFEQIGEKIFEMRPKKSDMIFSTDMYKPGPEERTWSECGEKIIIKGPNAKKLANWKEFLINYENKMQLIQVLQD